LRSGACSAGDNVRLQCCAPTGGRAILPAGRRVGHAWRDPEGAPGFQVSARQSMARQMPECFGNFVHSARRTPVVAGGQQHQRSIFHSGKSGNGAHRRVSSVSHAVEEPAMRIGLGLCFGICLLNAGCSGDVRIVGQSNGGTGAFSTAGGASTVVGGALGSGGVASTQTTATRNIGHG